jgi:serine protease Do
MPVLTEAAKSTVRVWSGSRRLAYGTVVGDGHKILTKWSEVARGSGDLRVETPGGGVRATRVIGVYEDEDIAVLDAGDPALTPVQWAKENPKLGAFLVAPQPDGQPAAFGVVSVLERNLRDTDQAYLGVIGTLDFQGPGVQIHEVAPESGAAIAGLKPGDIILKVGKRSISGLMELKNALVGVAPGSTLDLLVQAGNEKKTVDVLLGNRPQLPNFPGDRLRLMERMGGSISRVRDAFPSAIQSDMRPQPDQIGGPVVDLKGRVVGITLARADRTRAFIMPASALERLLKTPGSDPGLAEVRRTQDVPAMTVRERAVPGRLQPGGEERLRRHISGMQHLRDHLRQELEDMEK